MKTAWLRFVLPVFAVATLTPACSSSGYKSQEYAKMPNTKDFEHEYAMVWKGALEAVRELKLEERDQEEGLIVTDWVYTTSNDKYLEYTVNGYPRKKYLQTRFKYRIKLDKKFGFVKVTVTPQEEIENMKSDGSFDSWKSASSFDTGRAYEMLKNIELKILSYPDALDK